MFSIGEFSKINRITTKTLRHYDKIGLLKPCRTDSWTGYRYYSSDQLEVIRKILRLRDMGFSLSEIDEFIKDSGSSKKRLEERVRLLKEEVKLSQVRLNKALDFLSNFEKEAEMSDKVVLKSLPEVIVASMRTVVPGYDSYFDIVPKMGEYMESVGAVCSKPEYCFTIYHDGEFKESDIDVEICEAVEDYYTESEKVKFKKIGSVKKAACIFHKGSYKSIKESYNELFTWIKGHGYEIADNPRESYIDGIWNKEDDNDWLTEIQVPLKS